MKLKLLPYQAMNAFILNQWACQSLITLCVLTFCLGPPIYFIVYYARRQ